MRISERTDWWHRYAVYSCAMLLALCLYVPFHLLAAFANASMGPGRSFSPYITVIWPGYVLLATSLVFFTSGVLGFSLFPDLVALALLVAYFRHAPRIGSLLGLQGSDTGLFTMTGIVTATTAGHVIAVTEKSLDWCLLVPWFGLALPKAAGLLIRQRKWKRRGPEPTRRAADWRVLILYFLNAGLAAPLLAFLAAFYILTDQPLVPITIDTVEGACAFFLLMALGYAAGLAISFRFQFRGLGLRRPRTCAGIAVALFLWNVWGFGAETSGWARWHGASLLGLWCFCVVVAAAFAVVTYRGFVRLKV